jgi:hypothetical protein
MPAPDYNMTAADVATQLAEITRNSASFHARQLRAMTREGAITTPFRGGRGPTAPVLYSELEVARALVLHTLSTLDVQMPMLVQAAKASMVVDPTARAPGKVEPSDGLALAIARLRADPTCKIFLHLHITDWPGEGDDEGDFGFTGWVSTSAEVVDGGMLPPILSIVLPLHRLLKPLVA